jgi:RNA polymerase sigma-70 factor (ECF subfamily)
LDDQQLIRRIVKRRDANAANDLVSRYYDEIHRFALRQSLACHDPQREADDLTQEIFIAALRALHTYNPRKAAFRTWLYRVASSRVVDARWAFRPKEVQIDELHLAIEDDFVLELENADFAQNITDRLARFPGDVQQIVRLHIYADQTFRTIADTLGISESTVKSKYFRTVQRLKEEFPHDE